MDRIARMIERLPQFYRAWDRRSNFFQFLKGFSKELDEDQKLMFSIMRSHWVDTAYSYDLDLLGSLFRLRRRPRELDESFRRRIKFFIPEFTGGGTRESIIAQTMLYLDMREQPPILVENPPKDKVLKKTVKHGDQWRIYSYGVNDELPAFTITIQDGSYMLHGPMIRDVDTQSSVKFDGVLKSGQKLTINPEGRADLDGIDVTNRLTKTGNIMLRRGGSNWTFYDSLSPIIGRFDDAVFDKNVFEMYIPMTYLQIKWTARLLASFELVVPENALLSSDVSQDELEQVVDFIKASGVKGFVMVVSSLEAYQEQLKVEQERERQVRDEILRRELIEQEQQFKEEHDLQRQKGDQELKESVEQLEHHEEFKEEKDREKLEEQEQKDREKLEEQEEPQSKVEEQEEPQSKVEEQEQKDREKLEEQEEPQSKVEEQEQKDREKLEEQEEPQSKVEEQEEPQSKVEEQEQKDREKLEEQEEPQSKVEEQEQKDREKLEEQEEPQSKVEEQEHEVQSRIQVDAEQGPIQQQQQQDQQETAEK